LQHYHQRLNVLRNYFDSSTKLFLDLYPAKLLDTSAKHCFFNVFLQSA